MENRTAFIWQYKWLHIRNTAITHEDEKSEKRRLGDEGLGGGKDI